MKNFILKFHLELYTVLIFIITLLGFLDVYELTDNRKLLLLIIILGVFHEYEEKKYPGGFFENLGKVWGWDMASVDFRKTGQWVVYAWLIIAYVPYIVDDVLGLVLAPMFLGVFEMIIHTAGKKICNIKGWYVPGIVTGWLMGIAAIYGIYTLITKYTIVFTDCLISVLCVVFIMVLLQVLIQKAVNYSVPKMIRHMKENFFKK